MNSNPLLSWQAMLVKLLIFGLVSVALQRPVGSIEGKLSLEQKGFGVQTYDIKNNKVYVTASGPRGEVYDERGVWVKPDGSYRIDHLPKGEYSLKFHATGYSTEYKNSIFVDDGQVTELSTSLYILQPSVQIASNRRVFTTKESPYFWANCTGTKELTVRLYKANMSGLLSKYGEAESTEGEPADSDKPIQFTGGLDLYKGTGTREPNLFPKQKPVQVLTRKLDTSGDDWANAQFKLDKPLPCGDYVGLAEAKSAAGEVDWNVFWFNVSDLGLIVKRDREQFLIRAIDLNTLKPESGVAIQFMNKKGKMVYPPKPTELRTGADGFLTFKSAPIDKVTDNGSSFAVGMLGQSLAYSNFSVSTGDSSNSDTYKTYFYTERPVYRLGQTVFFKGMTRILAGSGLKNPAKGVRVSAVIEDPSNNKVWEGSFMTNVHGCWTGLYKVPEDGHTGGYQMTLTYPDDSKDYESFEVAEYRKPEYEVSVKPVDDRVISGGKIKARLKASYYFGAPVANAQVKYTVYAADDYGKRLSLLPRPDYYNYFDDWDSDDNQSWRTYSYGGDYISEGTAQTDAAGEALLEIDTKKLSPLGANFYDTSYLDKKYTIEAEVTDLSRMTVVGSGTCSVVAGKFALFVQSDNWVAIAGKPVSATVTAIDYDGKPVANQAAMLKLERGVWDCGEFVRRETTAATVVTTDSQGKATFVFDTKDSLPTDTYMISAMSSDQLGDQIYDQTSIWIASENYPYIRTGEEAKKQALAVKLDKPVYKPGEVAHAMITAPTSGTEGAEAIVAIEGTRLQKYWTVPMNATAKLVDIPILSTYEPNAYVTVTFVGANHQYYNDSRAIRVSPAEHFLNLTIQTDKEKYKPGDMVKYTVKATNATGQPVANAELSLGVVDESIYSIRAETAPNIQKFFYGKRTNWVSTSCTFGEEYSGGPDKTLAQVQVRKDFRDTAVWLPSLTTDKNGIAIASIKLPDNLTTWRATVRGITMGTDVGATIDKIISTKDLIVRLALPRFFSHGDQSFISAVVHNYTTKTQSVNLSLSAPSQFEVHEKMQQKLTVLPDKAQRFSWPVKLVASGPATITVKAIGETAADAMETKIPVLPIGIPAFSAKSGMLLDDPSSVEIPLALPASAAPESLKYRLGVSGSSIGPVLGNFDKLIDYPYGCTEQTMSRLMPSVVAMTLHKELNLPIDKETSKRFAKVYKLSMKKLETYQHDDGGWGWWETDDSNPYLTALVLDGFHHLRDVGYPVDQNRVKKGLDWMSKATVNLRDQLASPQHKQTWYSDRYANTDLAKMAYTLALYKKKPAKKVMDWLVENSDSLTPEAASYSAIVLKNAGNSHWKDCYKRLMSAAYIHDQFADWDHTSWLYSHLGYSAKWDYDYRFTGEETTAMALRAVLVVDPNNTDLIEKIKNWLLIQRDNNGWVNTKTTAEVFLALLEEQVAFNKKGSGTGTATLEVQLADKLLNDLVFNQTTAYAPETAVNVPVLNLPEKVTLKKSGGGRVYYNSLETYIQKLQPGEKMTAHCIPSGLSLERSFYRLVPTAKTSDGRTVFDTKIISNNVIHAGETVLMKVKVNCPVPLPYVILEAYLPSGAEIVTNSAKEETTTKDPFNWYIHWWTHQDILDDRIVFFVTNMREGVSEFSTLVRMEMPGHYEMNPLRIEGMYAKNVRGYSTLDELQVSE